MNGWRVAAGMLALWACSAAFAQKAELAPSAAVACLTPTEAERGGPEYPFNAYKESKAGRVKVALVFDGPAEAPRVEVLEQTGGDEFVEGVRQHVSRYRVPCRAPNSAARLLFDFEFRPDQRQVLWSAPTDAADAARRAMLGCVVRPFDTLASAYPEEARRWDVQGRVVARMRFVAPDQAPEVETYARPSAHELARVARRWVDRWRMPCLTGGPVDTQMLIIFQLNDARFGFPPMDLLSLMRAADGIERQSLSLDTRNMGCPFELKLQYLQPLLPNVVGEVGARDAAREPLLRWLRSVRLKLDAKTEDAVFADTADLAVPCVNIQLTPKEKTS